MSAFVVERSLLHYNAPSESQHRQTYVKDILMCFAVYYPVFHSHKMCQQITVAWRLTQQNVLITCIKIAHQPISKI